MLTKCKISFLLSSSELLEDSSQSYIFISAIQNLNKNSKAEVNVIQILHTVCPNRD